MKFLFRPIYWGYQDIYDSDRGTNELLIYISGIDIKGKSVFVTINDFTPYVHIQLPEAIEWNKSQTRELFSIIEKKILFRCPPESYTVQKNFRLQNKQPIRSMTVVLKNQRSCHTLLEYFSSNSIKLSTVGYTFVPKTFTVHESNIDPIIKLTAIQELDLCGWTEINCSPSKNENTYAEIEIETSWKNLKKRDDIIQSIDPRVCSFDIECSSVNRKSKLPDPTIKGNKVCQISCIFGTTEKDEVERYILTLGDPHEIENIIVKRFESEKSLLLGFTNLIIKKDPDIFIGYNIVRFDWNFLIARAELLDILPGFLRMCKIREKPARVIKKEWESGAYGEQKFKYPEIIGRINMDVLIEVERNHKLSTYTLGNVSQTFLKDTKKDLTAIQLFQLYDVHMQLLPFVRDIEEKQLSKKSLQRIRERLLSIVDPRDAKGEAKTLLAMVYKSKTKKELIQVLRECMTKIAIYCDQDSYLALRLAKFFNLFINMQEMSSCMDVPMSYLHTRGQQIKVVAQLYRECINESIIIPYNKYSDGESKGKFKGATVLEAHKGQYKDVSTLDFESLYPSIIIAINICYTTLDKNRKLALDKVNVCKWSEHEGCPHDKLKRKKKPDEIFCGNHDNRFQKIQILADGSRKGEGLLPRCERNLLTKRKAVKKEMAKAESILKMNDGLASEKDINYFATVLGLEIIKKNSLSPEKVKELRGTVKVLNSKQLALKVSANSMYGGAGAEKGYIPFREASSSVTYMGRTLIGMSIEYVHAKFPGARVIYGDTDSCMVCLEDLPLECKEKFDLANKISKAVTHYLKSYFIGVPEDLKIKLENTEYTLPSFPRDKIALLPDNEKIIVYSYDAMPLNLQFENFYSKYVLLTKKRYIAVAINNEGKIVGYTKKGVTTVRRDNCEYTRKCFSAIADKIYANADDIELLRMFYDFVSKLFSRQVPENQLLLYIGVKGLLKYAKVEGGAKNKKKNPNARFIDSQGNPINDKITDPMDERLTYPPLLQCMLAMKMIKRGEDVPANSRLEYVYIQKDSKYAGDKAEEYSYYCENKEREDLKIDYFAYLESKFVKPIGELLNVVIQKKKIPYISLDERFSLLTGELNALQKARVMKITSFSKEAVKKDKKTGRKRKYTFKGLNAKCEYILSDAKEFRKNKDVQHIDPRKHRELLELCRVMKSRSIINSFRKRHSLRPLAQKKPPSSGIRIPVGREVYLIKKFEKTKALTMGVIESCQQMGEDKNKTFVYTLTMKNKKVLKEVPREYITPVYELDNFIDETVDARKFHFQVLCEIQTLSNKGFYSSQLSFDSSEGEESGEEDSECFEDNSDEYSSEFDDSEESMSDDSQSFSFEFDD